MEFAVGVAGSFPWQTFTLKLHDPDFIIKQLKKSSVQLPHTLPTHHPQNMPPWNKDNIFWQPETDNTNNRFIPRIYRQISAANLCPYVDYGYCNYAIYVPQNKIEAGRDFIDEESRNDYTMRKKYSKQKDSKPSKERKCTLCLATAAGASPTHGAEIALGNLKRKYYYPQIETYHYRASNNLIYDPYSREAVELAETHKLLATDQVLNQYLPFSQTVQMIRTVVRRRVEKDFYGWVDFRDQHYAITNNYYMRRKHLTKNSKKLQKYLASCALPPSEQVRQYFEDRVRKELDNQRLVKLSQNDTNSSTVDLQRLTRNLEGMISKIADLSVIRPFPQGSIAQRKKAQNNLSLLFKAGSCGDISAIGKNQEEAATSPRIDKPNNYQESYGLQTIRPKHQKVKKLNKLSLRSIDKLNGFEQRTSTTPQTPRPRCFQGDNEYQQLQFNNPGNGGRANLISRKKGQSPMSPGNNHSSSLKNSKTLSRNGSQSSKRGR